MNCRRRVVIAVAAAWLLALSLTAPSAAASGPPTVNPALYHNLVWRNISPSGGESGGDPDSSPGAHSGPASSEGGRSSAVAGSAARPNEYYMGAAGGGLWKTTDGGKGWTPVTDHQITSSSVGAVAVCQANPDVVYIGTGEGAALRAQVIPGDGVYKSTDGGKTWAHLGLADTQNIGRIVIDPTDCNRVHVAALGHAFGTNTERGVFGSTDGGASWHKTLYVDDKTGAEDLSLDPKNPNVLYASMWQVYRKFWTLQDGGPGSGLYKSTDGGTTWTNLTPHLGLPAEPIGKIGVTVSAADPNRVYAQVEANGGAQFPNGAGLFRSDDAGATWKLINKLVGATSGIVGQRPFYFAGVFADTTNPNRVYAANTDFMRSDDGGATFSKVDGGGWDHHVAWIDPTNDQRMIVGSDAGASISTDGAKTWTAHNYPTGQFYTVATTNTTPYSVCSDKQDDHSICVSSTGGPGSVGTGGGEIGGLAVDPRNSNVFYSADCCSGQAFTMTRLDRSGQSAIGTRRVDPWPDSTQGYSAGSQKYRFQWTYPIVTNPAEPDAFFAGSQDVLKTTNGGQSWQQISPDLSYNDPATTGDSGGPINLDQTGAEYYAAVSTIAPSTVNKNLIWAGTDDGRVWSTTQGGGTWHEVTPPDLAKFTKVTVVDAGHSTKTSGHDQPAENTAYLVGQRYMLDDFTPIAYRTHDGGRHWTKITTGIAPNDYLWSIRQDPQRPDLLYATSEHGVYVSFDDGDHWQSLSLNLPDVRAFDLTVHGDDLVISTYGRAFDVCDTCAGLLRQLTPKTTPADIAGFHQIVPTPTPVTEVNPPPAVIPPTTHAPDAENDKATLHDPDDAVRSVSPNLTVNYTLKQKVDSAAMQFIAPDGTVIATNTLPTTAGSATTTWNLRHPDAVGFPGLIYWSGTNQGPKAPLGRYTVRLVVNGQPLQQDFNILKDSRLTHVTDTDIQAQFQLDLATRNDTNAANQDVINIRECTAQVDNRVTAANNPDVTQAGTSLDNELNAVQNELYQTKLNGIEDSLKYGVKLNDKFGALHSVIESVDGRPTDQTYQVFNELDSQLQTQLQKLRDDVSTDVPRFNQLLQQHGLAPINCSTV